MTPKDASLIIGVIAGTLATIIVWGYGPGSNDRCHIVSQVYQYAHDGRPPLRGSSEDGLNLAESYAVSAASSVSRAIGVSCHIEGKNHA